MLELYHSINSVCAQKVRIALAEKGLHAKEHFLTLRGDQFDPSYMRLNPNAVVPTLVHDGHAIVESSLILYYLDDAFPEKPLMPPAPLTRFKVRMFNKFIDEYLHNSCMILTFATAFRPAFLAMSPQEREAQISRTPIRKRAEYKRDVVAHGLGSCAKRWTITTSCWAGSMTRWPLGPISRATRSPMPILPPSPMSCGWSFCRWRACGSAYPPLARGGSAFASVRPSSRRSLAA
jgi:glutathione S-transferase